MKNGKISGDRSLGKSVPSRSVTARDSADTAHIAVAAWAVLTDSTAASACAAQVLSWPRRALERAVLIMTLTYTRDGALLKEPHSQKEHQHRPDVEDGDDDGCLTDTQGTETIAEQCREGRAAGNSNFAAPVSRPDPTDRQEKFKTPFKTRRRRSGFLSRRARLRRIRDVGNEAHRRGQ
jgi:hypothetical protein